MSTVNTVNLSVTLDINAVPPAPHVQVSDRNQQADPGDTIRWQRTGSSFDIVSLAPTGEGEAFSDATTGGGGQWLTSTYQPPDTTPGVEYPYTLSVTSGGKTYTTTNQPVPPEYETSSKVAMSLAGDKPVIRN